MLVHQQHALHVLYTAFFFAPSLSHTHASQARYSLVQEGLSGPAPIASPGELTIPPPASTAFHLSRAPSLASPEPGLEPARTHARLTWHRLMIYTQDYRASGGPGGYHSDVLQTISPLQYCLVHRHAGTSSCYQICRVGIHNFRVRPPRSRSIGQHHGCIDLGSFSCL